MCITYAEKEQFSSSSSSSSLFHVLPNTSNFQSVTIPTKTSSLSVHTVIYHSSVPVEGLQVPDVFNQDDTILLAVLSSSGMFSSEAPNSSSIYDIQKKYMYNNIIKGIKYINTHVHVGYILQIHTIVC